VKQTLSLTNTGFPLLSVTAAGWRRRIKTNIQFRLGGATGCNNAIRRAAVRAKVHSGRLKIAVTE